MSSQDKKAKEEKGKEVEAENPKNSGSGKEKPESSKAKEAKSGEKGAKVENKETVVLRPLTMEDLKQAKDEVSGSDFVVYMFSLPITTGTGYRLLNHLLIWHNAGLPKLFYGRCCHEPDEAVE